jgi:hypothetical protein
MPLWAIYTVVTLGTVALTQVAIRSFIRRVIT